MGRIVTQGQRRQQYSRTGGRGGAAIGRRGVACGVFSCGCNVHCKHGGL